MTKDIKSLLNHAFKIQRLILKEWDDVKVGLEVKESSILIYIDSVYLNYSVLESLSNYCIQQNITWSILIVDNQLTIKLEPNE